MKRFSLILILALLLSLLSYSAVFAQVKTEGSFAAIAQVTTPTSVCGWGGLENQIKFGKLYAAPGFNLKLWLRQNPGVTWEELNALNRTVEVGKIPGKGLAFGSLVGCNVIILPSR